MLYDLSMQDGSQNVHAITDLESCYDRQLRNIASLVEESVVIDRNRAKLIAKVLLVIQHHIYTRFGILKEYYGGVN